MTTQHTRYFAVVGRLWGDDEDSTICVEAKDEDDAAEQFRAWRWSEESDVTPESMAEHEEQGIGVMINVILESDTPIRIVFEEIR